MFLVRVLYHASGGGRGAWCGRSGPSLNPSSSAVRLLRDLGNSPFMLTAILAGRCVQRAELRASGCRRCSLVRAAHGRWRWRWGPLLQHPRGLAGLTPVTSFTYWFITCYLVFGFSSRVTDRLLDTLDRREFKRLLAVMFVVFFPAAHGGAGRLCTLRSRCTAFFFLYSITAYLRCYPDAAGVFGRAARFYAAGALVLLPSAITRSASASVIASPSCAFRPLRTKYHAAAAGHGAADLLGFRALRMPHSRLVNRLATACLGVYLIHYSYAWRDWIWHTLFGALLHATGRRHHPPACCWRWCWSGGQAAAGAVAPYYRLSLRSPRGPSPAIRGRGSARRSFQAAPAYTRALPVLPVLWGSPPPWKGPAAFRKCRRSPSRNPRSPRRPAPCRRRCGAPRRRWRRARPRAKIPGRS